VEEVIKIGKIIFYWATNCDEYYKHTTILQQYQSVTEIINQNNVYIIKLFVKNLKTQFIGAFSALHTKRKGSRKVDGCGYKYLRKK
jgi:hypothetical protein